MNGGLTYHVRGRQDAGSLADSLDVLGFLWDFIFSEVVFEVALEFLFGLLEML
jgi:hypothetical protein